MKRGVTARQGEAHELELDIEAVERLYLGMETLSVDAGPRGRTRGREPHARAFGAEELLRSTDGAFSVEGTVGYVLTEQRIALKNTSIMWHT